MSKNNTSVSELKIRITKAILAIRSRKEKNTNLGKTLRKELARKEGQRA
jgi:hypothetical protein